MESFRDAAEWVLLTNTLVMFFLAAFFMMNANLGVFPQKKAEDIMYAWVREWYRIAPWQGYAVLMLLFGWFGLAVIK